jgi:hypothetical protein
MIAINTAAKDGKRKMIDVSGSHGGGFKSQRL